MDLCVCASFSLSVSPSASSWVSLISTFLSLLGQARRSAAASWRVMTPKTPGRTTLSSRYCTQTHTYFYFYGPPSCLNPTSNSNFQVSAEIHPLKWKIFPYFLLSVVTVWLKVFFVVFLSRQYSTEP